VRRDGFRQDIDFHAAERLRRLHEPVHFGELLLFGQRRGLKLPIDPLSCFVHAGERRAGTDQHRQYGDGRHQASFHRILPKDVFVP
jgi:hypothetical protein